MARILVTGGAGFIGSHTIVELIGQGHEVVIADNLCNSRRAVIDRIAQIAGRRPGFVEMDVRDRAGLVSLMREQSTQAVVHFAGLKAVGESVSDPIRYYENNVAGSISVVSAMAETGVCRLVFSSSATVYGDPHAVPIGESWPLQPTNPYGQTKRLVEDFLRDVAGSQPGWRIAILRYFNPIGAHSSGVIGEDPGGIPNNLVPYVCQVAAGKRECLRIFGNDWPTPDGTGVRDYIHVVDLARGHVAAVAALDSPQTTVLTVNLGTGRGYSVMEIIAAIERASGRRVPYAVVARRPGDIAACVADPSLASQRLGWRATHDLEAMAQDAWRWQDANPDGYV